MCVCVPASQEGEREGGREGGKEGGRREGGGKVTLNVLAVNDRHFVYNLSFCDILI